MTPQLAQTILRLRRLLLGILLLGMLGLGTELLLLRHHEDFWQWIPLALIGLALAACLWHLIRPNPANVRALQVVMALFVVAGLLGVGLHYRASMEFQLESGTTPAGWELFWKALHAKVPPALAPAAMAQLGLLGLIYTYRHHSLIAPSSNSGQTEQN